jgi:hypothetical protein
MKAILIRVSGSLEQIEVEHDNLASFINADVPERVRVGVDRALVVDDTGVRKGLPVNRRASILYGTPEHGQPILGDALYLGEEMTPEGVDFVGIPYPLSEIADLDRLFGDL